MRITILSNWFPPVRSGSSYYTSSLAQILAARGNAVQIVTLDWGPEFAPPPETRFPIHQLPALKIPKLPIFYNLGLMGFAYYPANVRRLKALVREHKSEILHHVNHIFDTTFLSTSVARSLRIPIVGSITTPIQHQNPVKQSVMALADRATVGWFGVRRWDGIVSLDHMVHQYVGRIYGAAAQRRSVVIPFGVRMESMSLYEDRTRKRTERPQVLFVGHIHPFRNPVQLVRAMPRVLEEVPNARLVLAGRVDLREPVEVARSLRLSEDQVQFLDETAHEDIVELMKSAHVFANWVTGPYPALGTAPMEAMLCETPVINDLPEDLFGKGALKNGENILLVDSTDPRSIADAVIRLLTDEGLRRKIGEGGRRFVLEHLSWESIAEKMEKFYEQVITTHASTTR